MTPPLPPFDFERLTGRTPPPLESGLWAPAVSGAFETMRTEAIKSGVDPQPVSGWRSFDRQREIWNRKIERAIAGGASLRSAVESTLAYSAIPGTSRHHWGTDVDIIDRALPAPNDPLLATHYQSGGIYFPLAQWLELNALRFGFQMAYPNDPARTGFQHEPWHYSYIQSAKPILSQITQPPPQRLTPTTEVIGAEIMDGEFMASYLKTYLLGVHDDLRTA